MIVSSRIICFPGVDNVGIVEEGKVYRGAQPVAYDALQDELHIKTVINLRQFHSDVVPPGMAIGAFPMTVFTPADGETLKLIMWLMQQPESQPVFVHCAQGQDRTGFIVAAYRVKVQGWTVTQAWEEMQTYILSPVGEIWFPIRDAVLNLDK
jgi:tyrosine-protein phosphatase SIW14